MIRYLAGCGLALALVAVAPAGRSQVERSVPEGTFRYRVMHPTHGDIGSYTNVVRRQSDGVAVTTSVDIEVKVVFVTARSIKADRSEYWSGDRLVRYESSTRKGGETIRVEGRSEGERFVIDGPQGSTTAPPSVMPTNAWSDRILDADVVMASETGRLYPTRISGGGRETIEIVGRSVSTRHFRMEADTVYDLWFDDQDRVVRFTTINDGDTISFLLT